MHIHATSGRISLRAEIVITMSRNSKVLFRLSTLMRLVCETQVFVGTELFQQSHYIRDFLVI